MLGTHIPKPGDPERTFALCLARLGSLFIKSKDIDKLILDRHG